MTQTLIKFLVFIFPLVALNLESAYPDETLEELFSKYQIQFNFSVVTPQLLLDSTYDCSGILQTFDLKQSFKKMNFSLRFPIDGDYALINEVKVPLILLSSKAVIYGDLHHPKQIFSMKGIQNNSQILFEVSMPDPKMNYFEINQKSLINSQINPTHFVTQYGICKQVSIPLKAFFSETKEEISRPTKKSKLNSSAQNSISNLTISPAIKALVQDFSALDDLDGMVERAMDRR